ncbi:hypothetical protein Gotur_001909 [Gossypium turneri]
MSRFKEKDKRNKVEWHDRQWTNTERNREASSYASMELSDESDRIETLWELEIWAKTESVLQHSSPVSQHQVEEFYACLWDQESRKAEGYSWETIHVREKEVQITPREFARQNNIKVPNYTKDMFGLTHPEQEEDEHESEREDGDDEGEKDYKMDFEEDD